MFVVHEIQHTLHGSKSHLKETQTTLHHEPHKLGSGSLNENVHGVPGSCLSVLMVTLSINALQNDLSLSLAQILQSEGCCYSQYFSCWVFA